MKIPNTTACIHPHIVYISQYISHAPYIVHPPSNASFSNNTTSPISRYQTSLHPRFRSIQHHHDIHMQASLPRNNTTPYLLPIQTPMSPRLPLCSNRLKQDPCSVKDHFPFLTWVCTAIVSVTVPPVPYPPIYQSHELCEDKSPVLWSRKTTKSPEKTWEKTQEMKWNVGRYIDK